jgi:hypothetical protein
MSRKSLNKHKISDVFKRLLYAKGTHTHSRTPEKVIKEDKNALFPIDKSELW